MHASFANLVAWTIFLWLACEEPQHKSVVYHKQQKLQVSIRSPKTQNTAEVVAILFRGCEKSKMVLVA